MTPDFSGNIWAAIGKAVLYNMEAPIPLTILVTTQEAKKTIPLGPSPRIPNAATVSDDHSIPEL